MLRRTRLLLPLAAVLALVPATGAQAAKATFTGVFEASRSVKWDQPRGVNQINCRGENYYFASGGEEASIKTKPFKVTVQGSSKAALWSFGAGLSAITDPTKFGIQGKGPHKRWFDDTMGSTGGWCGGGGVEPRPERDCGTKLPTYQVTFMAHRGQMSWSANFVDTMANEKLHFYNCTLVPPIGMHNSSFPKLDAKYKQGDVFNRRKKSIVIGASKSYGPNVDPIANLGVNRTTSGSHEWKLTLTRK